MLSNRWTIRSAAGIVAIVAIVAMCAVVLGAGNATDTDRMRGFASCCDCPRVEIFEIRGQVARLDTATGKVHLLSGDPSRLSGRGRWRGYVNRIGTFSPGTFTLRTARGSLFLVHVESGETWGLSERGPSASWRQISVRR